jgi:hypothetical protein
VQPQLALTVVDNLVLYDDLFLQWYRLPGILDANRQLVGAHLHLNHEHADIKVPHPDRHTQAKELADPDGMGWHRGLRPKWGTFPHDTDPRLINCSFVNNITYLTTVSPGNGSTAVLDGSHKLEGAYQSLKERCPVVYVSAPAGSILTFSETLVCSG